MPVPTLETVEATVRGLSVDSVSMNMSVETYLQEAMNLADWADVDRAAFDTIGFEADLIDEIPLRVAVARKAESAWYSMRFSHDDARIAWDTKGPKAYEHRDDLLRTLRYAYRNDEALLVRVAGIAEGTGHADMVQDLSNIATLARSNPAPLQKVKFDLDSLNATEALAAELSTLLGSLTTDRLSQSSAKNFRDQALLHLKAAVDEIRAAGQYLNAKNPERFKGYVSATAKRRNASRPAKVKTEIPALAS